MKRLQAKRTTVDGIDFDSKSEAALYKKMCVLFTECDIIHPCSLRLPGKARSWKCDFCIIPKSEKAFCKLGLVNSLMHDEVANLPQGISNLQHYGCEILYLEYKGHTDLSTGLALIDKNFKARIDWLSRYADEILDSLVIVGSGSGGIVSYCDSWNFRVTPIHSDEFFLKVVRQIWLGL